ncbi:glycosyltransferase family 2 protein [Ligilactobacillus salivarius]|uniref:glycosyltransferase family 2 protein n=2 Tax=Ligilactobacillus salivarius TaxID=1624 RepID=UPI00195F1DE1|nr:glycosyltransferase family 2 protein [Ligilactobacillus salivarius]MBM6788211.1 glycosyltransferase family 2 protein [Ligilactobacillus salivarius]
MVKVSVGITVYNVEKYLRECLESVLNQTFTDFEVIMVDDGSTDNSFSICQEYVARDDRFKLIYQENKGRGQAGAKNTCLKHMTGEYVTWIDSDDVVDNNYLERLLEVQAETGADIVRCVRKYIRDGNVYFVKGYEEGFINTNGIFDLSLKTALDNVLNHAIGTLEFWGELIPRKLYKGVTLSQGIIHEDQGNKFKLYLQSKKNVMLLEQLYSYRLRQGSIMDSFREEKNALNDRLYDLQVSTFNWNKLMYYVDIANYKVEEMRKAYIKRLDQLSSEVNLSEEDNEIYRKAVDKYKEKLKRYWNM